MLNKSKGNMFDWVTHTWNTVKGRCLHDCSYCYMKIFPLGEIKLDRKELLTDLGEANTIFVGSSCDMWANNVPEEWIRETLICCKKFPLNKYLFQTKNPKRMYELRNLIPKGSIIGVTMESNRYYQKIMGKSPTIEERRDYLKLLDECDREFKIAITIEPILDFDLQSFVYEIIAPCKPDFVNIGADSKGHNLPEPSKEKILELVNQLRKFTEIKEKHNLGRLLK
jgi:DNA repair photolyase